MIIRNTITRCLYAFSLLRVMLLCKLVLIVSLSFVCETKAQNWDRFRGPNGTGQSNATGIPTEWQPANFLWKQPLPGVGHSSPVVWNGRLFVGSADPETGEQLLLAYDALTGEPLWQRKFAASTYNLHGYNSYASSTPTVDSHQVYFLWLAGDRIHLAALTHDGREEWQRDVGPFEEVHGFGKSPILVDGLIIIANDNNAESAIVAFDAQNGDVRWRVDRPSGDTPFASPCVLELAPDSKQLVAVSTAAGLAAFDVADGRALWHGLHDDITLRCVSSPIVAGGIVLVSCGQGGNGKLLIAARPGNAGQPPREIYRLLQSIPNVPTPVVAGELLFLWHDRGVVSCYDLATGKQHWRERVGGDFHSSPVRIGERIFGASRDGEVLVLAAHREFKLLARNTIGEPIHATPAVAHNRLYLRTNSSLICIGQP